MKKLVKALLMAVCVWLLIIESAGAILSQTWASLKSENKDEMADMLDNSVRKLYNRPVVYVFDTVKDFFLEKFEKEG